MQRSATSSAAWGLGLAACICNLSVIFLPIGLLLGLVALLLALLTRGRRPLGENRTADASGSALTLIGVAFLIAAIWTFTVASVFFIDPTLL